MDRYWAAFARSADPNAPGPDHVADVAITSRASIAHPPRCYLSFPAAPPQPGRPPRLWWKILRSRKIFHALTGKTFRNQKMLHDNARPLRRLIAPGEVDQRSGDLPAGRIGRQAALPGAQSGWKPGHRCTNVVYLVLIKGTMDIISLMWRAMSHPA